MNITPINCNGSTNKPAFAGRLIAKGLGWTPGLKHAFNNYEELKGLANEYDVVGRISRKKARQFWDCNHFNGQPIFKLNISLRKENSLKDKIKDFFGKLPRYSLTTNYHSEHGLINRFDNIYFNRLERKIHK